MLGRSIIDEVDKENCRPDFQILCYPIINLLDNSYEIKIIRNIILDKSIKTYNKSDLDSSLRVNINTPKTFIWHSRKDKVISYRQSEKYSKALTNNDVNHEFYLFEDGSHAIGLADHKNLKNSDVYMWTKLCKDWLEKNKII